jgi:prefoldin subunit 4
MRKFNGTDMEVTKEDQLKINNFSKLFQRRQELDENITKLKEKINQHQDTLDEIDMNNDDDILRYRFGACFFYLPSK